jgi:MtrB/PioB family decaheme-associated outer membrane protein
MTTLLLQAASAVQAQPIVLPAGPAVSFGTIDFGVRATDISGDQARFQRLRDIGDGPFLDQFRYNRTEQQWVVELGADHAGRRDQRYFARLGSLGNFKASFEWDQVPTFISADTATPYFAPGGPATLRIDDSIQAAAQAGTFNLSDLARAAVPFDLRYHRHSAAFDLVYTVNPDLDVRVGLKRTMKEGTQPQSGPFTGFGNSIELPAPVDTTTTDINADVTWANDRGMFRVGYEGQLFDNLAETLVWDNWAVLTDGINPSQGRLALSPDNTLHGVSTTGSVKLPGRSRLTGHLMVGSWRQDGALLPFTINTAAAGIPLDRPTADAQARTVAMNYAFTTRPNRYIWVNTRYRYYDLDNRTPEFEAPEYYRQDERNIRELRLVETHVHDYTRQYFDIDASFTPIPFAALKVGYGRRDVDRTFRIFTKTAENVFRTSIDTTGNQYVSVRGIYERSVREGSGFNLEDLLGIIAEHEQMRHFDIANRVRDRGTLLVQVTPIPEVGISASVAAGSDDYKDSLLGLRDNDNRVYSVGLDVVPREEIGLGLTYSRENYAALQNSRDGRVGTPTHDDPNLNWSIDSDDTVNNVGLYFDSWKAIPNTDLQVSYNFNRSEATYVYRVASGLNTPDQLPAVENELQNATIDLKYFLTERVAVGFIYWYDRYRVEDFAQSPETLDQLNPGGSTSLFLLGSVWRPYTAHSGWFRLTFLW